jgi:glyoxylase-like metal-dependent hydrolase (beta-lactamase superfamily II)
MRVSPSVRAVQVPDENPMHPLFTTMYLVGKGQVLTIDSGEALERYQWMLRGYLAAVEGAEVALISVTHHHLDHSGNLRWMREQYGADVLVHADGAPLMEERLPEQGLQLLSDGQMLDLGGGTRVRVLLTPGHSVDSVCFYLEEEGVLFTGDTILGGTTTTVWDLAAYRASLQCLLELPNLSVLCPGHGPLIDRPRETIGEYIAHRDRREQQILAVLGEGGPVTSWEIMLRLYPEIDTRLRRAADGNVQTHLRKLEGEGRLQSFPGVPKQPDPAAEAEQAEHARERAAIKEQAAAIEKEERRAALAAQENPPSAQWEEMPRYTLVGRPDE